MSKHFSNTGNKLLTADLILTALKEAFIKLNPAVMVRNPVMFTVEVGTVIMIALCVILAVSPDETQGGLFYNLLITIILFLTILFGNFAESIAEARGKAQAESLRKTRQDTPANLLLEDGSISKVMSSDLKKGDVILISEGEIIPSDGEIIEGIATIDESAITGESAPVIREAGGDRSGVTGGTKVLSDRIKVLISIEKGESFLDKMIMLVEGASRQKTPNEIALSILLSGFTIMFLIVTVTLEPFGRYSETPIALASLIALFVCLIPTTIGGLLSAIGIAGMDRALKANVIAKSGKAVETAGDIDTLLLDKTGTITIGNRKATKFYALNGFHENEFTKYCALSSMSDETPEGKSIIELAGKTLPEIYKTRTEDLKIFKFTAQTRMSGIDIKDGTQVRKGAFDVISKLINDNGEPVPDAMVTIVKNIAEDGGTPLAVAVNGKAAGVIQLEDIIKTGIQERFKRLRKMGVKTVMVTGDNPLTAKFIANAAGVDDYIAEAKPEDKMNYIIKDQQSGKLVAMMGDGTNDAPALAQADVGVSMNSGTQAAKDAGNMVDLDNDPTKLIEVVEIGKQLLITRGAVTTFSIANDVAKYFAIVPALFVLSVPGLQSLNIMNLSSPQSAILSAVIFNALIIPMLIPLALKGVAYKPVGAEKLLGRNIFIYGLGGIIAPFIAIKMIDIILTLLGVI